MAARDPSEDFVADILRVVAANTGTIDTAAAQRIETELRTQYGGERIYIHREGWFDRSERDQRIRAERAAGASVRSIAKRYTLSASTVHAICGDG